MDLGHFLNPPEGNVELHFIHYNYTFDYFNILPFLKAFESADCETIA